MWITVPDYFLSFKCIADKCRDSCCIGWEIDIDEDAKLKYEVLSTPLGKEIREKTSHGYFPLEKDGRCAFLDCTGLCRIIKELGEGYLCDICNEHPRYYGVGNGGFEGGLGLGCDEAARIILSLEKMPKLVEIERDIPYYDEDPKAYVSNYLRDILYDKIFGYGIEKLIGTYTAYTKATTTENYERFVLGFSPCMSYVAPDELSHEEISDLLLHFFQSLEECEAITDDWEDIVYRASKVKITRILKKDRELRGLFYYFTHRYIRECFFDRSIGKRLLFVPLSALAIIAISEVLDGEDKEIRAAVFYSKNIEYSTENIDYLLSTLSPYM